MQAQPELMRQHEAYRAVRERLFSKPKPAPALAVLRDYDAHVRAFRDWNDLSATLKAAGTSTSVSVSFGPYANYAAAATMGDDAEPVSFRRSMREICLDTLRQFPGISIEDVKGAHRTRRIVAARHTCMYAIYMERKDVSFPALGRFFGGRDHSSCIHAVRNIENGKVFTDTPPGQDATPIRKISLSREERDFLKRVRDGLPLTASMGKDRTQERPRARMRSVGFAKYSDRGRRWNITPSGLEALKRAEESA